MPLTKTSHLSEFTRPPPDSATFAFPPPLMTSPYIPPTLIFFRASATLGTKMRWHATHTEYIKVVQGAVLVTVSGVTRTYTKDDGVVEVPRCARHEWMRFGRPAELLSKGQREAQDAWTRFE